MEMANEISAVGQHAPVVHEEVGLLLEGEKGLGVFHRQIVLR